MSNAVKKVQPESPDVVCPLFAEAEPPMFAKHVGKIRIFRLEKTATGVRGGKVPLSREDYYIDGNENDVFEIDPYKTCEEDLQEQFGAGEYWIDALHAVTGKVFPNGRRIFLGGPVKRGGLPVEDEPDTEDDDDEEEEEGRASRGSGKKKAADASVTSLESMLSLFRDMMSYREKQTESVVARERETAAKQADMQNTFAATMFQIAAARDKSDPATTEVLSTLRRQLESALEKSSRDLEELRRDQRSEIARRDREIEDMRRAHQEEMTEERRRSRSDLERREQEIADLRASYRREEEESRRKHQRELDEQRSRYEKELSGATRETLETRNAITKEADRVRKELEKKVSDLEDDVHSLKKENIELERALAKAQNEAPEPSAAGAAGLIEQFAPVIREVVTGVVKKTFEGQQGAIPGQGSFVPPSPQMPPGTYGVPDGYPQAGWPPYYAPPGSAPPDGSMDPNAMPYGVPPTQPPGMEAEPPEPQEPTQENQDPASNVA